jgi:hypothetical protein
LALQNLKSMVLSIWDIFMLPFQMFNNWLGIDMEQILGKNDVCPGAGSIRSWLKLV